MRLSNSGDGGSVINRTKDRTAGRDGVRASLYRPSSGFVVWPAVGLDDRIEATLVADLAQAADLGQRLRQELLAAEARIDSPDEDDLAEMEDVFNQSRRARRAEHHARLLAEV